MGSIRSDTTPGMTTLLRLPNMDILLAPEEQANPRRSDRIRNLSHTSSEQQDNEGPSSRGKRRRRYNSVMEDDIEESESKRREPEHRRLNRLRLMKQSENDSPVTSPEDNQAFSESLNKEKTLVEILLRKYGFGQWKLPHEEGNEETPNQEIYPSFLKPPET